MDTTILENLKAVLTTTPQRWHGLTQNFSDDMLRRQPKAGEWSALECLLHLIDLDKAIFPTRTQAFLEGKDFPAFDPDSQGTKLTKDMTGEQLAQEFEAIRKENLKLVDTITLDDLTRTANHGELGQVTLGNLLNEWGGHDLMHIVQAEQALMQPFILDCGAWQPYFSDHIVG